MREQNHRPTEELGNDAPVALFTDTYFEVNGVAKTFRKMTDEFAKRELPLHIFTYGERFEVQDRGSVKIFSFNHQLATNYYEHLEWELFKDPRVSRTFRAQMAQQPYRAVHIATPGSMGLSGRNLASKHGVPLVGSYHTHLADYTALRARPVRGILRNMTWSFLKWYYKPCSIVVCPTDAISKELIERGFKNPFGVFTRGIDTDFYTPLRRTLPDGSPTTVLYVGRLAPEKSVGLIPDIVNGLNVQTVVVGDGPERGSLERRLKNAVFTGYCHGDQLANAYANADILLFPSTTDTFGNVVLEAMSSGVVPIVADACGPRDYVTHGENAMVCKNVGEMRAAVEQLSTNQTLRQRIAQRAREFALRKDWRIAVEQLRDTYRSVIRV